MPRHLTPDQARALMLEDADHVPYRILSSAGRAALVAFVAEHSKAPNAQNMGAWFGEAETSANNTIPGHTVSIEMGRHATRTGVPEVLRFDPDHFDWVICDAAEVRA